MLFLLKFFTFIYCVHGLFEDQVGKFDWRQQLVGKVKFGRFEETEKNLPRKFFVATEQNVVASINFVTGDLSWRQVFERGNSGVIDDLLVKKDEVISLSGDRTKSVRSYDAARGHLRWEWSSNEPDASCANSKLLDLSGKAIAVLMCNRLITLDSSGSPLWSILLKPENVEWLDLLHLPKAAHIVVRGKINGASYLLQINAKTGNILLNQRFDDVAKLTNCGFFLEPLFFSCIDVSSGTVRSISLSDFAESTATISMLTGFSIVSFYQLDSSSFGIIDEKSVARVFSFRSDGTLEQSVEPTKDVVALSYAKIEEAKYFVFAVCADTCEIRWFETNERKFFSQATIFLGKTSEINGIAKLFPVPFAKMDRSISYRAIVAGVDDSLASLQTSGKPFWVRQEALASIITVEMLDLPLSEAQASVESEFSTNGKNILNMFVQRLSTQARQIQRGVLRLLNESLTLIGAVGTSTDWLTLAKSVAHHETLNMPLERDYFNLHKILVVVSNVGKVFGLDSRQGKVVWQFFDKEIEPFISGEKFALPLFTQRTTAHYPFPAQVALVGRKKDSGVGRILFFDPIFGKVLKSLSLNVPIKQASALPFATTEELFGLALLTGDDKILIFPTDLEQVLPNLLRESPFFLFNAEYLSGLCEGFRLDKQISVDNKISALVWSAERVWKFVLPIDRGGKIVDIKLKRQHEHVHSQGRVLGDRSVLYKYSNPNLVAVAVQNVDDTGKGGSLSLYLFDAITGETVFSVVQRRVAPPFHIVHCENWLVYTYWNEKARRTEFAVLEFYEGKSQSDPDKFTSFVARPTPFVMRQAYVFPHGVNALAVTDTEKGITTRHLLVALPFGGVLELHKAFLDPRRVLIPTQEEREEGLIPYMPDLPIATEHLINYNQSVINVRAIHTAPAGLESTSLVLVYGLDLFYTRVNPSATFDILKDDFDHWLISLMLLGLFLASVITKRLAKYKDLKLAWK